MEWKIGINIECFLMPIAIHVLYGNLRNKVQLLLFKRSAVDPYNNSHSNHYYQLQNDWNEFHVQRFANNSELLGWLFNFRQEFDYR